MFPVGQAVWEPLDPADGGRGELVVPPPALDGITVATQIADGGLGHRVLAPVRRPSRILPGVRVEQVHPAVDVDRHVRVPDGLVSAPARGDHRHRARGPAQQGLLRSARMSRNRRLVPNALNIARADVPRRDGAVSSWMSRPVRVDTSCARTWAQSLPRVHRGTRFRLCVGRMHDAGVVVQTHDRSAGRGFYGAGTILVDGSVQLGVNVVVVPGGDTAEVGQ